MIGRFLKLYLNILFRNIVVKLRKFVYDLEEKKRLLGYIFINFILNYQLKEGRKINRIFLKIELNKMFLFFKIKFIFFCC